jgi:hypothetical protein
LAVAMLNGPESDEEPMAIIEVSRPVVEYLNKGASRLKAFDSVGYMVMQNVIICQTGQKQAVIDSFNRSLDTLVQVVGGSSSPGPKA